MQICLLSCRPKLLCIPSSLAISNHGTLVCAKPPLLFRHRQPLYGLPSLVVGAIVETLKTIISKTRRLNVFVLVKLSFQFVAIQCFLNKILLTVVS